MSLRGSAAVSRAQWEWGIEKRGRRGRRVRAEKEAPNRNATIKKMCTASDKYFVAPSPPAEH